MSRISQPLAQQVIVIAGASSEIGLATIKIAAARHAKVVLIARSRGVLAGMIDDIVANGGDALYLVADIAQREEMEQAARVVIDYFGRIDAWVNDAGIFIHGQLEEIAEFDSRRLFDFNFWGVVNGSLAALPHLRQQGGTLINIGSEIAEGGLPMHGMYSAAKQAVKAFTETLRMEAAVMERAPVAIHLIEPLAIMASVFEHSLGQHNRHDNHMSGSEAHLLRVADAILQAATRGTEAGTETAPGRTGKVSPLLTEKRAGRQPVRAPRAAHQDEAEEYGPDLNEKSLKYLRR